MAITMVPMPGHIHTPEDGRRNDRVVLVDGRPVERCFYADTQRGIARCYRQPLKLDYLWAALCLMGAVYFIFRT